MSKKKKKNSKYSYGYDTHHLLWQRRYWGYGDLKTLRLYPYCRLKVPTYIHREIHERIKTIPSVNQSSAREVLKQLKYLEEYKGISEKDSIGKRLRVLIALFECIEEPTAKALKKQLDIVREFYNEPQ